MGKHILEPEKKGGVHCINQPRVITAILDGYLNIHNRKFQLLIKITQSIIGLVSGQPTLYLPNSIFYSVNSEKTYKLIAERILLTTCLLCNVVITPPSIWIYTLESRPYLQLHFPGFHFKSTRIQWVC